MSEKIDIQRVCAHCGGLFTAHKTTTTYCSHRCSSLAYKQRKREERIAGVKSIKVQVAQAQCRELDNKEYLSPSELATLLGVGRSTIYRHIKEHQIEVVQTKGRTRIRREDIQSIFGIDNQHRAQPIRRDTITDLYTIREVMERYRVSESWVHKMVKSHNIPKVLRCGKSYVSCSHIDKLFAQSAPDPTIEEWYTVEEIESKFKMSKTNIYHCASENHIPKRKVGKAVHYSKHHFDIAQGIEQPPKEEWYTMEEAMEKFELTRDSLYHHIKRNNITKIKSGRYIKVSKKELDNIFIKQILL